MNTHKWMKDMLSYEIVWQHFVLLFFLNYIDSECFLNYPTMCDFLKCIFIRICVLLYFI